MKKTVITFFVSFQTNLMMLSYTYNVTSVYGRIYIENQCLIEYPYPPIAGGGENGYSPLLKIFFLQFSGLWPNALLTICNLIGQKTA